MKINQELSEKLTALGRDPQKVTACGVRVSGDKHGVTLRLEDGTEKYFSGPLVTVEGGGQCAIVRFG